jgi:putative spermidine/putrescine transport system permease protein|tara:strand:- start:1430 stop:2281 length:852 start_codon:yes stop_codon:yes gene_type:complete
VNKQQQPIAASYLLLTLYCVIVSFAPLLFLFTTAVSTTDPLTGEVLSYGLANFQEVFYDAYYAIQIAYTVGLVAAITVVTLSMAVPLTLAIAKLKNGARSAWVVMLLASLALSEVLTAFAWQLLLSHSSGIPGWLSYAGIISGDKSWWPSFPAMFVVLVYFSLPIAMILLLPAIRRLDPFLKESAYTMGFSKIAVFFLILLPSLRGPIFQTAMLTFLLNIGGFVISQQLGKPSDWMFAVFIADFMRTFNIPFAVALSFCLLIAVLLCLAIANLIFGRKPIENR